MSLKIEAEIKIDSEPCVAAWDKKLFIGTEDGSIKSFDQDLNLVSSWPAHAVQIFAVAAGNGSVYSASNDGGVRVWSADGQKIVELTTAGPDVGVLRVFGKAVYVGDEGGNVLVFEDNAEKARYNVLEEVKDLEFSPPYMFTVRDLNVTITEIKPEESKSRFVTRHTMEGRAPLQMAGKRLLCTARGGNNLRLHDASVDSSFKLLHDVKVSDMILTSLVVNGDYAWTGGWDGCVRRWKIAEDRLEAAGEVNLGACVNALQSTDANRAYAVLAGGRIVYLKVL
ncbi:uncharacterized protein LOC128683738 [Plodia interpunctella]|uniref:uncharacterized protein LOC128683738 n=1 Tax=Plodia interpunctella TaxID=58824 RepID=UPI002368AE1A|nr:uncharacterized protein LOC128683738 [Plodia interpunctella]